MFQKIKKAIPNTLTCCNLVSGCVATMFAFQQSYELALLWIVIGAVFDFFDGMSARALHVSSNIGKELDSLADDITFGFAPSAMLYSLLTQMVFPDYLAFGEEWLPYVAFVMAAFSGVRLAKFNLDTRQTLTFIGLPTPANALFWGALVASFWSGMITMSWLVPVLLVGILAFSLFLIAEIPLFALKFKNYSWADNKIKYVFLAGSMVLLVVFGVKGISMCIAWYIALALSLYAFSSKKNLNNQ